LETSLPLSELEELQMDLYFIRTQKAVLSNQISNVSGTENNILLKISILKRKGLR
jgi:hypothetical protein